jgi:hypothetical protein
VHDKVVVLLEGKENRHFEKCTNVFENFKLRYYRVVGILNACESFGTNMLNKGSSLLQELKFSIYFSVSVLVEYEHIKNA